MYMYLALTIIFHLRKPELTCPLKSQLGTINTRILICSLSYEIQDFDIDLQ